MSLRSSALASFAFLCAFARAQYTVTDIGTLPGGTSSHGYRISNAGTAVGFSMTPQGARAFVWTRGTGMVNLGVLRNDPSSFAIGISGNGTVAGYSGSGVMRTAFRWTQGGGMVDLGTYGTDSVSLGLGVNDLGHVAGMSGHDAGVKRAFLHKPGLGMTDLGFVPGRSSSFARDVNNIGQVVGHSAGSDPLAFLWQNGAMSALPNMVGGSTSTAMAVNDVGAIAGWATDALGAKHAVVWQSASLVPQSIDGTVAGIAGAEALDINVQGQVVGYGLFEGQERAIYYDPVLGAVRLDAMLGSSAAGWTFLRAQGINDAGEIVGYGLFNGQTRGFVASPVPEPGSLALLGLGLFAISRRRRR